ncbi:helix-hairpin-helix domain-containing protein [Vibrio hepatarius]|uniref:helix-hairpin-helix domain-containing protein n=1 Tax=Vibrio hepatarius TaxID=171383 RepID=UPI00142E838C|nr:helix-hairpin-helix domain-containing protein [Vibrio hepatarius]NIY83681.1 helix-hairpin-helix domain-containing protein [Vibrio hepatarius]
MAFSESESKVLLSVKGVGPTVLKRFEEIWIDNLSDLAAYQVDEIAAMVASMLRTTCWKNSPQAKAAIKAAIQRAKDEVQSSHTKA